MTTATSSHPDSLFVCALFLCSRSPICQTALSPLHSNSRLLSTIVSILASSARSKQLGLTRGFDVCAAGTVGETVCGVSCFSNQVDDAMEKRRTCAPKQTFGLLFSDCACLINNRDVSSLFDNRASSRSSSISLHYHA
uniref:Secreted protein n=1 Tax=Steinernema glaseri TaxID=37863 RepID=A0A1I7ZJI6_9BILA